MQPPVDNVLNFSTYLKMYGIFYVFSGNSPIHKIIEFDYSLTKENK